MTEKTVDQEPVSKFKSAVNWATEKSLKEFSGHCGICDWQSAWKHKSKNEEKTALSAHIRRRHQDSIVELFDAQVLNLSDLAPIPVPENLPKDDLLAVAGISDSTQLDRTDLLAIPDSIRKKAEENGETFYWKRAEEVENLKSQGAKLVYTDGHEGVHQHSTENGVLRTRELVCMALPHELSQARRRQKDARIPAQVNARAEEIRVHRDEFEKRTYDYLRSERNLDHSQAQRVTSAVMSRREREIGQHSSNIGMTITDNAGRSEY